MAYPPHALVAFSGTWTYPDLANEVWQFGIRVSTHDAAGGYLAGPQAYCDQITPLVTTWFHGGTCFDSQAKLTMVKVNNIQPDGHYHDPVTHQTAVTAGNTGGAAMISPAFCTIACTLETGRTTGRARRGRIYPPVAIEQQAGRGVTVEPVFQTVLRDKIKALLTILLINEPTGGLLLQPSIVSRVDASHNDINGVSVNSVIDVQRRRKNRAIATRTPVAAFP
jgi:hypothetical protein